MNTGPRGASKSVILGGGSLYLIGARESPLLLCFGVLAFGSGVALELISGACNAPPFDSLFFSDSFFALDVRSRARGVSSLEDLKSGFNGEDTVGRWSSSSARFCGMDEIGAGALGIGSGLTAGSGVDIVKESWIRETRKGDECGDVGAILQKTCCNDIRRQSVRFSRTRLA